MESRFRYYNHALIPVSPEVTKFDSKLSFFDVVKEYKEGLRKTGGGKQSIYFVLYNTDYDCKECTNWWYTIKDSKFDIQELSSNRRHKILKGIKNYEVRQVKAADYVDEIYEVYKEAVAQYPTNTQYIVNKDSIKDKDNSRWFIAFDKESGKIGAFAEMLDKYPLASLSRNKATPYAEKRNANFALLNYIFLEYDKDNFIITNGQRNLRHKTQFNEFLIKYFNFRRAYCRLNIKLNPLLVPIVFLLYPFRTLFSKVSSPVFYNVYILLKYVEISRS